MDHVLSTVSNKMKKSKSAQVLGYNLAIKARKSILNQTQSTELDAFGKRDAPRHCRSNKLFRYTVICLVFVLFLLYIIFSLIYRNYFSSISTEKLANSTLGKYRSFIHLKKLFVYFEIKPGIK